MCAAIGLGEMEKMEKPGVSIGSYVTPRIHDCWFSNLLESCMDGLNVPVGSRGESSHLHNRINTDTQHAQAEKRVGGRERPE